MPRTQTANARNGINQEGTTKSRRWSAIFNCLPFKEEELPQTGTNLKPKEEPLNRSDSKDILLQLYGLLRCMHPLHHMQWDFLFYFEFNSSCVLIGLLCFFDSFFLTDEWLLVQKRGFFVSRPSPSVKSIWLWKWKTKVCWSRAAFSKNSDLLQTLD